MFVTHKKWISIQILSISFLSIPLPLFLPSPPSLLSQELWESAPSTRPLIYWKGVCMNRFQSCFSFTFTWKEGEGQRDRHSLSLSISWRRFSPVKWRWSQQTFSMHLPGTLQFLSVFGYWKQNKAKPLITWISNTWKLFFQSLSPSLLSPITFLVSYTYRQ